MKIKQFKLRFDKKSKRYAKVFIFPTRKAMEFFYSEQLKHTGQEDDGKKFGAMFQPYTFEVFKKGKKIIKNHTGNFLFCQERLGAGVVAHECGHAALFWYSLQPKHTKYVDWKVIEDMEDEEELLFTLGYLVAQFWDKYYKLEKK